MELVFSVVALWVQIASVDLVEAGLDATHLCDIYIQVIATVAMSITS